MMQAAMTAISNRIKVNSIDRKSKGKAPIPPVRSEYDHEAMDDVDHMNVRIETETPQITTMKVNVEGSQPDLGELNLTYLSIQIFFEKKIKRKIYQTFLGKKSEKFSEISMC